ncbi:EKA-like protein [Blumeria hordei DH14]|uniref:EKA-like protein n=1 Tax=Blumeria graminis f. sp. hordei (strain DH14) TaxID=546991 RepID=N1JCK5_BLUG1|nr:EKA-like protein [Blumeria hordei DH14]
MNAIVAALQAKDNFFPEVEMVDAEVEKLKALSDSKWASSSPKDAELSPKPADTYSKTVTAPEKHATAPALPRPIEARPSRWAEIRVNKASGAENLPRVLLASSSKVATILDSYPPELRVVIEVEERWETKKAAQFTICSTTIDGVEAALAPLSTGENKDFVDSIKVYLRAAITQFVVAGASTTPPVLPHRPIVVTQHATATPVAVQQTIATAVASPPSRSTWATVTRAGLQKQSTQTPAKNNSCAAAPAARKPGRKSVTAMSQDDRLFLRLDENHVERQLSPTSIREIDTMRPCQY